jgi:TrmH family RNA methyltransferase
MAETITKGSKILKEYRLLGLRKYREKRQRIILEGYHLLREALKARVELESVFYTDEFIKKNSEGLLTGLAKEVKLFRIETPLFKTIAQTETPQGIAAIARLPFAPALLPCGNFFLILDGIQDPGNLGTIIRAAASVAVDAILLLPGTVDPYNPKALRAGMGGTFYLPIIQAGKLQDWQAVLRQRGMQLIAADPRGTIPYYDLRFDQPSAVIIGNESRGISPSLLAGADLRACIPLQGKIASLNAAMAASIFIFENRRQRKFM